MLVVFFTLIQLYMKKNITIKELSKILEVSISTVSKALNDSYEISESTKQRIKEAAKLYNYKPNKLAVNLKSGKTNTIGVVLPSIKNFFFIYSNFCSTRFCCYISFKYFFKTIR